MQADFSGAVYIEKREQMIVNEPALDWLRMTTYNFDEYEKAVHIIRHCPEWERAGIMQYRGNRCDGLFHGQGEQKGRTHYMIDTSGGASDDYGYKLLTINSKVTRMDLQLTLEKPCDWNIREFTDAMREGVWPNRTRNVTSIDGNGDDTIYIGSRSSEKYIRIYVKSKEWLRFEIELKGDAALLAARLVRNGGKSAIAAILASEIGKLPSYHVLDYFAKNLKPSGDGQLRVTRVEPDKIKRLRWLASLLPAIEGMMVDHDYGHTVFSWFDAMLDKVSSERAK